MLILTFLFNTMSATASIAALTPETSLVPAIAKWVCCRLSARKACDFLGDITRMSALCNGVLAAAAGEIRRLTVDAADNGDGVGILLDLVAHGSQLGGLQRPRPTATRVTPPRSTAPLIISPVLSQRPRSGACLSPYPLALSSFMTDAALFSSSVVFRELHCSGGIPDSSSFWQCAQERRSP